MSSTYPTAYLKIGANQLAYTQYSSGNNFILAIHGFGQNKYHWSFLKDHFENATLIAIDLPFHGASKWVNDLITLEELDEIICAFKHQFQFEKLNLIGFSMGARVCLNIVNRFPALVNKSFLIAPDGLHHNFWYTLATRRSIGKSIFKYIAVKPKPILKTFDRLHQVKLLKEGNYNYFKEQFANKTYRINLYKVWNGLSALVNDIPTTIKTLNQHPIDVTLIMGQYDKIINIKYGEAFKKLVPKTQFHVLKKGHRLLNKSIIPYLITNL